MALSSSLIKKFIVNSVMTYPNSVKELTERHATTVVPAGYCKEKNWKRHTKVRLNSASEQDSKLPFEAVDDVAQYGVTYLPLTYPCTVRLFILESSNDNDDCQLTIVTDANDQNVLGWHFECD